MVIKQKVLVLVAYDVDAICALRILQYLFQTDSVQYTATPVSTISDIVEAYSLHRGNINSIVCLNVGATTDIIEDLDVDPGVTVFVLDSHRPINHFNIFRDEQVFLLMKEYDNNVQDLPAYDEVIDDDEEDLVLPELTPAEIRRLSDEELEMREAIRKKIQEKRRWAERAENLLNKYYMYAYFGDSAALTLFDLAWKLSRDNNELLWLAIVGVFDQHVNEKIDPNKFMGYITSLQSHVSRLSHLLDERASALIESTSIPNPDRDSESQSAQQLKNQSVIISYIEDLQLILYRHWSLYESLRHTINVCTHFKIWTPAGHNKLLEYLASLGIPLTQSKQRFQSMEKDFRQNLQTWMEEEEVVGKYHLGSLVGHNFVASKGYKFKYSAMDVALGIRALVESPEPEKSSREKFQTAIDALSWSQTDILESGLEIAKTQVIAILKQVHHIIDLNTVEKAGPFFYCVLRESTTDLRIFCHPAVFLNLARFIQTAVVAKTKFKKAGDFSFVLFAPDQDQAGKGIVAGVPPVKERQSNEERHNFFGKAFRALTDGDPRMVRFDIETDLYDSAIARFPYSEKACGDIVTGLIQLLTT